MTSTDFSPIPSSSCPSYVPAVNGLRNAYMQKYVLNAATAASNSRERGLLPPEDASAEAMSESVEGTAGNSVDRSNHVDGVTTARQ